MCHGVQDSDYQILSRDWELKYNTNKVPFTLTFLKSQCCLNYLVTGIFEFFLPVPYLLFLVWLL